MEKTIVGSINLSKVDKKRLFVSKKTGEKWLNIVVISTPSNEFSDFMVVESITKEERDKGEKGTIIGNLKYSGGASDDGASEDDGLPF